MDAYKKQLTEVYRPFFRVILVIFGLISIGQIFNVATPYFYGRMIDAISSEHGFKAIIIFAFIILLLGIAVEVIEAIEAWVEINYFNNDVKRSISVTSFKKIMSLSIGQHINENSGAKRSVIAGGDNAVHQFLRLVLYEIAPLALSVIAAIIALIWMNYILGFTVLFSSAIYTYILIRINKALEDDNKKRKDIEVEKEKTYDEIIRNTGLILLNAKTNKASKKYFTVYDKWIKTDKLVSMRLTKFSAFGNILNGFFVFFVIMLGAWFVKSESYSSGEFLTFVIWVISVFGKMGNAKNIQKNWIEVSASLKKYFSMMEIKPDIIIADDAIQPANFQGNIQFQNISFRYPKRKYINTKKETSKTQGEIDHLSNINLKIKPGEKIAIVGKSGSGKSTFINLLTRAFDPRQGQVLIDGINLKKLHLDSFRKNLGVVEQDVVLFDDTLRYNITFGINGIDGHALEQRLKRIIEVSRISEFLPDLENGLDTIIGERGVTLSGGQRQRVGIARALIKDPIFLIFDEATSSLDTCNEAEIHQAMTNASKGRTTIIIAHRLSTIKESDMIFVFDAGRIVGQGRHDQLLRTCNEYQKLVEHQYL